LGPARGLRQRADRDGGSERSLDIEEEITREAMESNPWKEVECLFLSRISGVVSGRVIR
jgi:hypothetical protein